MLLKENNPLDLDLLKTLFGEEKEELFLVWPYAKFPFKKKQWEDVFNTSRDYVSLLFYPESDLIGHSALLKKNEDNILYVSFCFLTNNKRGKGLGKSLISMTEDFSIKRFKPNKHRLVVRDYNPKALHIYQSLGFLEYDREGTLIKMEKKL